uniref:Uncharacterized protein n=1 Tax=Knipowitschia caucasica TaxID=637954 RepID=A0AAV2JBK7_KNICA
MGREARPLLHVSDVAVTSRVQSACSGCPSLLSSGVHRCGHTVLLSGPVLSADQRLWRDTCCGPVPALQPFISFMLIATGARSQRRLPESEQPPSQPWLKEERERMRSSSSGL